MPLKECEKSVKECERVWKSVEECGRVWKSVEECGRTMVGYLMVSIIHHSSFIIHHQSPSVTISHQTPPPNTTTTQTPPPTLFVHQMPFPNKDPLTSTGPHHQPSLVNGNGARLAKHVVSSTCVGVCQHTFQRPRSGHPLTIVPQPLVRVDGVDARCTHHGHLRRRRKEEKEKKGEGEGRRRRRRKEKKEKKKGGEEEEERRTVG